MFNKKNNATMFITFICVIVGFMMAIQFASSKEQTVTEARDNIDLRIDLQKERQRKEGLLNDLAKAEQLLYEYQNALESQSIDIMAEELEKVKLQTGLLPIEGPGTVIKLQEIPSETIFEDEFAGSGDAEMGAFSLELADEDLRTLVNELFNNGAKAVSINGQRLVTTSTIRNVADRIQVNTHFVQLPLEIRVLGDPDKVIAGLVGQGMEEYFGYLNIELAYEKKSFLQIPAYEDVVNPRFMVPAKEGE